MSHQPELPIDPPAEHGWENENGEWISREEAREIGLQQLAEREVDDR